MAIDGREENEKAQNPILRNNESDSKETDESDSQILKQKVPRISTLCGMTMERKEEYENASGPIARTKRSAPIWTINRQRRIGTADCDSNLTTMAPWSSNRNITPHCFLRSTKPSSESHTEKVGRSSDRTRAAEYISVCSAQYRSTFLEETMDPGHLEEWGE
jgi:hypothetical protein